jgi:exosome complex component RRP42
MTGQIISAIRKDYLHKLAEEGKRADGRSADETRNIFIEYNVISRAEGSARVKLGNTEVFAGIKMEIGAPYPDTLNSGVLITNAELTTIASPDFESGPPGEQAVELARVVDRGIRESEILDFESLCIEPGEKVWLAFLDLYVIDYDGNLLDASNLASLAALYSTKIPNPRYDLGEASPLPVSKELPISCTVVKYNDFLVADPSLDEEMIADARITFVLDSKNNIRAIQKGGKGSFTQDEIKRALDIANRTTEDLRKKFKKVFNM